MFECLSDDSFSYETSSESIALKRIDDYFSKVIAEGNILRRIINTSPVVVRPDVCVQAVLTQMGCGTSSSLASLQDPYYGITPGSDCALVMSDQGLQGIFNLHDVVRLTALGLNLAQTTIAEVMASPVLTIQEADLENIKYIFKTLKQNQVSSAPVISRNGEILGMITAEQLSQFIQQRSLLTATSVQASMLNQVVTITSEVSGTKVAQLMQDYQTDCVVIVQSPHRTSALHPIGIITARDIAQYQTLGLNLNELEAITLMSYPLMGLQLDDSLLNARHAMQHLRVKRLVVVDQQGILQGTLSEDRVLSILGEPSLHKTIDSLEHKINQIWMDRTNLLQKINAQLTEQVQETSNTLKVSQEQFRATFEQAAVGMAHVNFDGSFRQVNLKFCDLLGYTQEQFLQRSILDITHSDDQSVDAQQLQKLLNQEITSFSHEERCIHADGSTVWVSVSVSLALNQVGEPDYFIAVVENISERKSLETQLRQSEQQMRNVFESMHDIVLICALKGHEITDIHLAPTHPHYGDNELVIRQTREYLLNPRQGWGQRIQSGLKNGELLEFEYCLSMNDHELWFMATVSPMSDDSVLWVARDISDRKQAEQALYQEKNLAQVTLRSIGDAVISTDVNGIITNFNPVAEQLTGWHITEVLGQPLTNIFTIVHEETREPVDNPILSALKNNQIVKLANNTLLISREGKEYAIEDSAAPIRDLAGKVIGAVMVFHDVTYARHLTRQLSWQASHDPLTRLFNRRQFDQVLQAALQNARQEDYQHVLCFLDLDQFKIVNDSCGHAAGDELLCQVAKLLKSSIRSSDTLARLGGDEFAILLHQCPIERAQAIAQQLCHALRHFRFSWDNKTFNIGVSIGIVPIDHKSPGIEKILSAADAACYTAKAKGRNRVQLYLETDEQLQQQRGQQQWSVLIKQAIEDRRLCLYGQPIVPSDVRFESQHRSCEVLLRMFDNLGQIISAGEFIQAAERFNLITDLDRWVVTEFLERYQESDLSSFATQFMINLSGVSINDEQFLDFLHKKLVQYPTVAKHICFEITETAAISNLNKASRFIKELQKLGCQFALDDFGSGMSSFAYLKELPIEYIKIDGRFIEGMDKDSTKFAIVEAINHVGHVMGIKTIAEFVSSSAIREQLNAIGVNYVQGYEISKPMPLTNLGVVQPSSFLS